MLSSSYERFALAFLIVYFRLSISFVGTFFAELLSEKVLMKSTAFWDALSICNFDSCISSWCYFCLISCRRMIFSCLAVIADTFYFRAANYSIINFSF